MKNHNNERGQSLVELSISILILLLLLVGAVEFGMAFFQFVQLRDAAQEGALYGSLHPKDTDFPAIRDRVKYSSQSPIKLSELPDSAIEITLINGSLTGCEGSTFVNGVPVTNGIEVKVSYDHDVFMPFMKQIVGDKIQLNATVTDTILQPRCQP